MSPKQQRRPLPCLLYLQFFYEVSFCSDIKAQSFTCFTSFNYFNFIRYQVLPEVPKVCVILSLFVLQIWLKKNKSELLYEPERKLLLRSSLNKAIAFVQAEQKRQFWAGFLINLTVLILFNIMIKVYNDFGTWGKTSSWFGRKTEIMK